MPPLSGSLVRLPAGILDIQMQNFRYSEGLGQVESRRTLTKLSKYFIIPGLHLGSFVMTVAVNSKLAASLFLFFFIHIGRKFTGE